MTNCNRPLLKIRSTSAIINYERKKEKKMTVWNVLRTRRKCQSDYLFIYLFIHLFIILFAAEQQLGYISVLTFTILLAHSADNKLVIFFYFSQKTGFGISCKLSLLETICMKSQLLFSMKTICMKCQILFSEKNKKNITHSSKVILRVLSVKC